MSKKASLDFKILLIISLVVVLLIFLFVSTLYFITEFIGVYALRPGFDLVKSAIVS